MTQLSGYAPAELLGRPAEILVPRGARQAHQRTRRRYLADPTARPMGAGLMLSLRRKEGTELLVDVALAPL